MIVRPDGSSPVEAAASVKDTASPTSSVPEGLRVLVIDRSLPAVSVVVRLAVLLPVIGSGGAPPRTLPSGVTVEVATGKTRPVKDRSTVPPTGTGPAMGHE